MRSGIYLLLVIFGVSMMMGAGAAAAELSPEAVECFQWFSGLGYPEIKDAVWVELTEETLAAAPGTPAGNIKNTRFGFIVGGSGDEVHILQPNLVEETYHKDVANHLGYLPPVFRKVPFEESARKLLADTAIV